MLQSRRGYPALACAERLRATASPKSSWEPFTQAVRRCRRPTRLACRRSPIAWICSGRARQKPNGPGVALYQVWRNGAYVQTIYNEAYSDTAVTPCTTPPCPSNTYQILAYDFHFNIARDTFSVTTCRRGPSTRAKRACGPPVPIGVERVNRSTCSPAISTTPCR